MKNQEWLYLDYNASTPMAPEVISVMSDSLESQAHPSSKHPDGQRAAALISKARAQVARSLSARPEEIIFCSGSTEAANHVIKGVAFKVPIAQWPLHFITSAVDHAATVEPLRFLERIGHQLTILPANQHGSVTVEQVEEALQPNTILVSLIHGQNEVGTLLPLEQIGSLCATRQVLFHVDAAQSFGKSPVSVQDLNADFLQIAGHKIYGPKGVGALYVRQGRHLEPLLHGAGHESGARSGTPAPALAAGLGEACRLVSDLGLLSPEPANRFWKTLSKELGPQVRRNGDSLQRVPNVVHATFFGRSGEQLLQKARICASTGAACHSATGSPVLKAMGFSSEEAVGSVRLSFGRQSTMEDADLAASRLAQAFQESATTD